MGRIVFLDRKTVGEDIDLTSFERFGEIVIYDHTEPEEIPERARDAQILVVNKTPVNAETIAGADQLQLVCVTATGTNNLDKDYLKSKGIAYCNVAGYSTGCVAQHTFALTLSLLEHLNYYDSYVKDGSYVSSPMFTHFERPFHELSEMCWGIVGMGAIGRRVAGLAEAFGADVQYYSTSGENTLSEYPNVDFDTLLETSDIISIHAPLNADTEHLFDKDAFAKMKPTAILINVGRGPIIVEEDLVKALETGEIAAAGLDVLDTEPMSEDSPLRRISDSNKLIITPHIAWAGVETRRRLVSMVETQIEEFLAGRDVSPES